MTENYYPRMELEKYLRSKLSMYQINIVRDCQHCEFCDLEALEFNRTADKNKQWDKSRPVCTYAFKIEWDQDDLALICPAKREKVSE